MKSVLIFFASVTFVTCQEGPKPDFAVYNISVPNTVYRFVFPLAENVFVDFQGNNISKIQLEWLLGDGSDVTKQDFIQLKLPEKVLIGYVSPAVYDAYPKPDGFKYLLKGTDLRGKSNSKIYYVKLINAKPTPPSYVQSIVLRSEDRTLSELSDVEILFSVQNTKLLAYSRKYEQAIPNLDSIITESLAITRNGISLEISLVWSSTIFLNVCPVEVIKQFRRSIIKNNFQRYQASFLSEFQLQTFEDKLHSPCVGLSLKRPVVGTVNWNSLSVRFGRYFSLDVPTDLFQNPEGATMEITLVLLDSNGNALPDSYWIRLAGTSLQSSYKVQGYITYNVAVKSLTYDVFIIASTPFEMESRRSLQVTVIQFETLNFQWTVSMQMSTALTMSPITFFQQFVSTITEFLQASRNSILIIDYTASQTSFAFDWTVTGELSSNQYAAFTAKIETSPGKASSEFTSLIKNIGSDISSIQIKTVANRPTPKFSSFNLNIRAGDTRFIYALPKNTFTDVEDGDLTGLTLQWLTIDGNAVSPSNWVQLRKSIQALIGFITPDVYARYLSSGTYTYVLKATDKDGNSNTMNYTFEILGALPTPSYYFQSLELRTTMTSYNAMNDVEILFRIQENFLFKYNTINLQGIDNIDKLTTESLKVSRSSSGIVVLLTWGSTIFFANPCPFTTITVFRKEIISTNGDKYVRFFLPDFVVTLKEEKLAGTCAQFSLNAPTIGPGSLDRITLNFGSYFSTILPENLFIPPGGSLLTSLRIVLTTDRINLVDSNNWILVSKSAQNNSYFLQACVTENIAKSQLMYNFFVTAITPFDMRISRNIIIQIASKPPDGYKWQSVFQLTQAPPAPLLTFIQNLVNQLSNLLSIERPQDILIVNAGSDSAGVFTVQWSIQGSLTATEMNNINSKLNMDGEASADLTNLIQNIGGQLTTVDIVDESSFKPMPDVSAEILQIDRKLNRFNVVLNPNVFTDKQDGDVRQLSLQCLTEDQQPLSRDNFIQLDLSKLQLIGYLSPDIRHTLPITGYKFILKATDKDGYSNIKTYIIQLTGVNPISPSYEQSLVLSTSTSSYMSLTYVQILYYIQDIIFSYNVLNNQGIGDVTNIITNSLRVERNFGKMYIYLSWSGEHFKSSTECPVNEINRFREALRGVKKDAFGRRFNPNFIVESLSESLLATCSALSLNPPNVNGNGWKLPPVIFGKLFTFNVPPDLFTPPGGTQMKLTLELRDEQDRTFSEQSWVTLNGNDVKDLKIQGYFSLEVARKQTSYQLSLVATTLFFEFSRYSINVKVIDYKPLVKSIWRVSFKATRFTGNFVTWVDSFITALARFLSVPAMDLLIVGLNFQNAVYDLQWTFQNVEKMSCASLKIQKEKLSNGAQTNSELEQLLNSIGYYITRVEFFNADECDHITIRKNLGKFHRYNYFQFSHVFDIDAYKDPDNHPLTYSMEYNNPFLSQNWIGVYSPKRRIYGTPIIRDLQKGFSYTFNLKVTDTLRNSIIDEFYVNFMDEPPRRNHLFQITASYTENYHSLAELLDKFLGNFFTYFGSGNEKRTAIYYVDVMADIKQMELYYFNTTFSVDKCDRKNEILANEKLFDGVQPSKQFIEIMQPYFMIKKVLTYRNGTNCISNYIPIVNPSVLYRDTFPGILNVTWGEYYSYKIVDNVFRDENHPELNLILGRYETPTLNLPTNTFISFDKEDQTIYLVPDPFMITSKVTSLTFYLSAFDSKEAGVSVEITVKPQVRSTDSIYQIKFYIDVYNVVHEPYAKQLTIILPQIEALLGLRYKNQICVQAYEVLNVVGTDGKAVLTWTPCTFPEKTCDYPLISDLQSLFYLKGIINPDIRVVKENVRLTNIMEYGVKLCRRTPPQIKRPIPPLSIPFCGLFQYEIPEGTFFDAEDGYTRNLKLSLRSPRNNKLPDWIYFDAQRQKIYALPTSELFLENPNIKYGIVLMLEAEDQSFLKTSQALTLALVGQPQKIDVKISVQGFFHTTHTSTNVLMIVAQKVGKYFGDNAKGFEAISSSQKSSGETLVEFGNCTIPYNPCHMSAQQEYISRMKSQGNTFKKSFRDIFSPEANMVTLGYQFDGPCVSTDHPPKVKRAIGRIYASTSRNTIYYIPRDAFNDAEDGATSNLKLELKFSDRTALLAMSWISFDERQQAITIIASRDKGKQVLTTSLLLIARDRKDQSAEQTIHIIVEYPRESPSHYFSMDFILKNPSLRTHNQIYEYLRSRIKLHYREINDNVGYISTSNKVTGRLNVKWTNVSISRSFCDIEKITKMASKVFLSNQMSTVNVRFQNELSNFQIMRIELRHDGICKSNDESPELLNPFPILELTLCDSIKYQVPVNTFRDAMDGNTRKLKISVMDIPEFISFQETSQTLFISPIQNLLKLHSSTQRFQLQVKATNSRGRSTLAQFTIHLKTEPSQYNYFFRIYARWWMYERQFHKIRVAQMIVEKTKQYFQNQYSFRVIRVSDLVSNQFEIDITPCGLRYSSCDTAKINYVNSKILNVLGTSYHNQYALTFYPELQLYKISTFKLGSCSDFRKPPRQYLPLPRIQLNMCADFSYKLDRKTFIDHDENHDLMYVVSRVNGKPIDEASTWIASKSSKEIFATVSNSVLLDGKSQVVTIRAFDKFEQFVEAPWHINVNGAHAQEIYEFVMELKVNGVTEPLVFEQYNIVRTLNRYFKENITNIIHIESLPLMKLKMSWSPCTLPNYCDNTGAENILRMMKQRNNQLVREFQNVFMWRYQIISIDLKQDKNCDHQANTPPRPSTNHLHLNAFQCDGFTFQLPPTLVYDKEDGYIENLKCILKPHSTSQILPPWVFFDEKNKIIYAYPSREEVVQLTSPLLQLVLIVSDKDGAEASININIDFKMPMQEKFSFVLRYNLVTNHLARVQEVNEFKIKMATYMNKMTNMLTLISYKKLSTISREIVITHCTKSHQICDKDVIEDWKRRLLNPIDSYPNNNFLTAMSPNFLVQSVFLKADQSCYSANSPPVLLTEIHPLQIPSCGVFSYRIPRNCFYDKEDGDTRNLDVNVLHLNGHPVSKQHSWIFFDKTSQTLYAVPLVRQYKKQGHNYLLTATDKSFLTTKTEWTIIIGKFHEGIEHCTIKTNFRINKNVEKTTVEHVMLIIEKMRMYFQLDFSNHLAIIDFIRSNANEIDLYWTYCLQQSHTGNKLRHIVEKVFLTNLKTVQPGFIYSVKPDYTIIEAETQFAPQCTLNDVPDSKGPQPKYREPIYRYASPCEEFMYYIPNDLFTHPEEGDVRNMHVSLVKGGHNSAHANEWVEINKDNPSFLYIYGQITNDVIKNARNSRYEYMIVCTDSRGKSAEIQLIISLTSSQMKMHEPEVVFLFGHAQQYVTKSQNHVSNSQYRKRDSQKRISEISLVRSFVKQLSSYLDPNKYTQAIHIHSLNANCYLHFSFCSNMCDHSKWQNIVNKINQLKRRKSAHQNIHYPKILQEFKIKSIVFGSPNCNNRISK